jgi:hypothetical protein
MRHDAHASADRSDDQSVERFVSTGVITMSTNEGRSNAGTEGTTARTTQGRRRKIAAVAAFAAVAAGGGAAWALWSAGGSGSGQASALTAQSITVTAAAGPATLYPGATDGDVTFTLTNPNPYPVELASMTAGAITTSNPACASSNITVAPAAGLALAVGPNATSGVQTIADVVSMSAAAPDACQGVTFTIALTLTGSQV